MFSVARGLNRVHGHGEKRWYVVGRLICSGYTIVFILVCILSLGLLVFGNMIQAFMVNRFPIVADVVTHIINFRALWALMILIMFFLGIYTARVNLPLGWGPAIPLLTLREPRM